MVAANLLRKTASELFEMGVKSKDLPTGIRINKAGTRKDGTRIYYFDNYITVPKFLLSNKIKNHPNYIKVSKPGNVTHAMNKRLGTESTLKEAVGMNKKNTNFVFGKYKKLDQETLDGLLKTNKYKNLKGLSAIGKQLDKDNYLTQSGVPFRKVKMRSDAKGLNEPGRSSEVLITRKLRDYEIPEKFKIKEGAENLSSKQKKLIKETYARRKKIASYVEKNPSLFTGTSTQKNAGLNELLGRGASKNILGLEEIVVPNNVKNILEKLPKTGFFADDLKFAGYSEKTIKLQNDILKGLRKLGKNRKNFDHNLPITVVNATKLPRSYKIKGEHHSFAFNMAKKDYDKKLAKLVVQRQNRVNGGEGLTASQFDNEIQKLRKFFDGFFDDGRRGRDRLPLAVISKPLFGLT